MTVDRDVQQDVAEVLVRYATGIDRRDWDLFRTCFTADVEADYGDIGTWHGVDEITDWMAATHEPCGHTLHRMTNVAVTPVADGRCRPGATSRPSCSFGDNETGCGRPASTTTSWSHRRRLADRQHGDSPRSSSRASATDAG